jgi:enediyne biosynthesis protein E4
MDWSKPDRSLWAVLVAAAVCNATAAAVERQIGPGFRSTALTVSQGRIGFALMPQSETGISFTNALPKARYTTNQIYLNGSGVAAGDIDADGWCDIFFAGLGGQSSLYRNSGNWKFSDVTRSGRIDASDLDATAAAFADLDGDFDLDLVVSSIGQGIRCFQNDGRGRFSVLPSKAPLNLNRGGMSIALADVDGDGDLDLYVANYRTSTLRDMPFTRFRGKNRDGVMVLETVNGRPVTDPDLAGRFTISVEGRVVEHGEPDALFLNDGSGRFEVLPLSAGAFQDENGKPLPSPIYDWGLSAMFRDMNADGAPDIYVCNDFSSPDQIWINNGKGQFRSGAAGATRHTSLFSMGVDFADLDRDGQDEFFTTDMLSPDPVRRRKQIIESEGIHPELKPDRPQYQQNMLFYNRGDGTFAEIGQFARVHASEWSWTPAFLDVDLDGYEDLLITTGHERETLHADIMQRVDEIKSSKKLSAREVLDLSNLFPRLTPGNMAFRNRGNLRFEDVSATWRFNTPAGVSHGLALADLDNDGDQDVVINNLNGPVGVYRNESPAPRLAVRLRGLPPNTSGIGAKIQVKGGAVPFQSQEIIAGGRYLSSDQALRTFAAGALSNRMTVEVTWRDGRRSVVTGVEPGCLLEISEDAQSQPQSAFAKEELSPLFQDASSLLDHRHQPSRFEDFSYQPTLPRQYSSAAPGISWLDVNEDGIEDLAIPSGRGNAFDLFLGNRQGTFARMEMHGDATAATRAVTAITAFGKRLIIGTSNLAYGSNNIPALQIYDLEKNTFDPVPGSTVQNCGPLAVGDLDGDGDLDLFAGSRGVPGRYPETAPSLFLKNENGRLAPFQWIQAGRVNGALCTDLDQDGKAELVLACDWSPIRIFKFAGDNLTEITAELGFAAFKGWWNGIAAGDFDGDGNLDLAASNWGLNSTYQAAANQPQILYYGEINAGGPVELLEGVLDPVLGKEASLRDLKSLQALFPALKERRLTSEQFATMGLRELFPENLPRLQRLEATVLESSVFLNRRGRFERRDLPAQAQWSPAFGISLADADGDGAEDLFLAQNFFGVRPGVPRNDAGAGLWLRGKGDGSFEHLSPRRSGISLAGEQRGCALADFDQDGRIDLAVAQYGAETKLFHNVGAKAGIRLRLRGPETNPNAVGASMRIIYADGTKGPLRTIHAGSGFLSQDSPVQNLGTAREPSELWVRWPDGKTRTYSCPKGNVNVEIKIDRTATAIP